MFPHELTPAQREAWEGWFCKVVNEQVARPWGAGKGASQSYSELLRGHLDLLNRPSEGPQAGREQPPT